MYVCVGGCYVLKFKLSLNLFVVEYQVGSEALIGPVP